MPKAPAPGNRYSGTGTLYGVSHHGYSWSSAPTGSNAYCLNFHNTRATPQNSDYRAYGFQVRCLQE